MNRAVRFGGGGGMHFGGGRFAGGGFRGGMVTGRSAFVPGVGRFAHTPFAGRHIHVNRFVRPFFFDRFHRRVFFNNSVFFGGYGDWPYYDDYAGYGGCQRNIWTPYGWKWTNVCNGYGNYVYGY